MKNKNGSKLKQKNFRLQNRKPWECVDAKMTQAMRENQKIEHEKQKDKSNTH